MSVKIKTIAYPCIIFIFLSLPFVYVQGQTNPAQEKKMNFFSLSDVQLLDGEFKHIQDLTHRYLLTLEPDRLCSWFRREAGLTPKAPPYPGWDSGTTGIPGHILGFYLSSMSMMYETTSDPAILERLKYTLIELDECQNVAGDGYLSAVINGRLAYEKFLSDNSQADAWKIGGEMEPTYIMNKITLGLYGVYTKCNLPLAKKILTGLCDWFGENIVNKLDEDGVQKMLVCEHGSLSESFANVYDLTGDRKYIAWAKRLNDERMLIPASEGKDILPGWHGNCQIQKFPGFEAVYRCTGEKQFTNAALFFWKTVVNNYTWVIGGNAASEHFYPKEENDNCVIRNGGPEACNTVNMLRLTEALYEHYALPEMADFYERALINHILGAYEPERGMIAYMLKLQPGGFKTYGSEYNSFWCCTGTGFESPAKFQKMIYTYDDKSLYVNLYIPSELQWKEKGITIRQQTKIPDEEQTVLEIQTNHPQEFSLKIRHPYWVEKGKMKVLINGKSVKIFSSPSQFAEIKRTWKTGDCVTVELPMKVRVEPLTDKQKFVSVSYGPVVLAAAYSSDDLRESDYFHESDHWGNRTSLLHLLPLENFSWLIGSPDEIAGKVKKVSASPLTFRTEKAGYPDDYTLIPLNRIHYSRYVFYFPHSRAIENVVKRVDAKNILDEATIDAVCTAYDVSELEHKMEAISTGTDPYGGKWRFAYDGGYFMYNLKSSPSEPMSLYLVLSSDVQRTGTFDILIDGHLLMTINQNNPSDKASQPFYTEIIPIPEALTKGKNNITVKFHAKRGNSTKGIFDVRLIKTAFSEKLNK